MFMPINPFQGHLVLKGLVSQQARLDLLRPALLLAFRWHLDQAISGYVVLPVGSYHTPFFGYSLLGIGYYNQQSGTP